ncbi:SMP-30/gluconolactonase/LRE family protein [Sphingomonas sp. R86520]|uniref:SMP-30/gluconolactonase/LRE family protein n=1 Tax=Sphingomonas sp. R86520 TaxID=3093859 RepID=UPI0036D356BB
MIDRRAVLVGAAISPLTFAPAWSEARETLDAVLMRGARVQRVYDDGRWCEGPVWDRQGGTLVFSDVRKNRIMRLGDGGVAAAVRDPSNFANGNAFDASGRLLTCEHLDRRVVRQEADGRLTVLADRFEGRRLNSPNDLIVARDGAIWFTDPTFGIEQPEEGRQAASEQRGRFVFRIDPAGGIAKVADTFEQPNGLAFSPDERILYVSDASGGPDHPEGKREIRTFDVRDGRSLTGERVFATVPSGIADGLKVDSGGCVYAATDGGATVWTVAGDRLGVIATPGTCGNLAFGGTDGRRLFLCNGSSIHAVDLKVRGAGWRA